MLTPEEIVPVLDKILADQVVFLSKLQDIIPGSMTHAEIHEMEEEVYEAFDLMKEMIPAIATLQPDPAIIGDRFKRAFENVTLIFQELTPLHKNAPE
jgi:hypothetical protein